MRRNVGNSIEEVRGRIVKVAVRWNKKKKTNTEMNRCKKNKNQKTNKNNKDKKKKNKRKNEEKGENANIKADERRGVEEDEERTPEKEKSDTLSEGSSLYRGERDTLLAEKRTGRRSRFSSV